MNGRRLIAPPSFRQEIVTTFARPQEEAAGRPADVRFGSLADICAAPTHVYPNSDRESGH
jgi:hypothetical protein